MKYAISNGGKSARAIDKDSDTKGGEVVWNGALPRVPGNPWDSGLVIDAGIARAKNAAEQLQTLKAAKIRALKDEAINRARAVYGEEFSYTLFIIVADIFASLKAAAKDVLAPRLQTVNQLRIAATDAVTVIQALSTVAEVLAYDVTTAPAWP